MKRSAIVLAACLAAAVLLVGGVLAAGGVSGDPVISLDYLNGTFLSQLLKQTRDRVDTGLEVVYQDALNGLGQSGIPVSGALEQRVKTGDQLTLASGGVLIPLAGQVQLTSGGAVDATTGMELAGPAALEARHRYIITEQGSGVCTVLSDTAVLSTEGTVTLAASGAPDYNRMADALKSLDLFRGSNLSIGSGYELEAPPTRIQGLIMFLRLIGEEQAALTSTAAHPFRDVPGWCDRYVAYAYQQGYTNGVDLPAGLFGPGDVMTSAQYMTLLLRALGYTDSGSAPEFNWAASVAFGQNMGLLTEGEYQRLTTGVFYRAQVAYISYYALSYPLKGQSVTLLDRLVERGAVTQDAAQNALGMVTSLRL